MDRADRLNDAIDALLAGQPAGGLDELGDLRPLVDEGRVLLHHRPGAEAPGATFLLGLEAQLVTDLRLRAPMARRGSWRPAPGPALAVLVLAVVLLFEPVRVALPWWPDGPLHRAWDAVSLAIAPDRDERVRQLLLQGWRRLDQAEAAGAAPAAAAARSRALDDAVARYRLALATAAHAEVDARVRSQAEAEVRLVMSRLARQAHGLPPVDRVPWTVARMALGQLLVADYRVVHLPPGPSLGPAEENPLPSPSATEVALQPTSTALPPPTELPNLPIEPTLEAWPTVTSTPTPSAEPSPWPTDEPTPRRANPPTTPTAPAASPTAPVDPPALVPTPTQDRWPTATPQASDPGPPTPGEPPPPSEPPPTP